MGIIYFIISLLVLYLIGSFTALYKVYKKYYRHDRDFFHLWGCIAFFLSWIWFLIDKMANE